MSSKEPVNRDRRKLAPETTTPLIRGEGQTSAADRPDVIERSRSAPQSLSPAEFLRVQRLVGNRAADQLLARRAPVPAARSMSRAAPGDIQRLATAEERRDFGQQYYALLTQLKKGKTSSWPDVHNFVTLAQARHLDTDMPDMYRFLQALDAIVSGGGTEKTKKLAIKQQLDTMDPASRTGPEAYTHVGAAMFAPEMAHGAFKGPAMQALEGAEQARLGGGASDVDVKINLVLDQMQRAYVTHRAALAVLAGGGAAPNTLAIFAGPEWYFRQPTQPYDRNAEKRVVQTFLEISTLYPDMLIMPGSIISGDLKKGTWTNVTNTAPVFWNGNLLIAVHKTETCGELEPLKGVSAMKEPTLFNIGDLRGAMEICADHHKQRAAGEVGRKQKLGGPNLAPSIQIVAGAGQTGSSARSAVRHQGFLMSADSTGQGATMLQVSVAGTARTDTGPEAGQELLHDILPGTTKTHNWVLGEDRAAFRADRIRYGMEILAEDGTGITYAKPTSALKYFPPRAVP